MNAELNQKRKVPVHSLYIGGFLIFIIIVLLTKDFGRVQDFASLLSFALTLSSLILSLIAIVYAIVSNGGLQGTVDRLHDASNEIKEASISIISAAKELETEISSIREPVVASHALLQDMNKKANNQLVTPSTQSGSANGLSSPARFLDVSSDLGLLTLLALEISYSKKRDLNLNELCKFADLDFSYCYGFFISTTASGWIWFEPNDDSTVFKIKSFNENLKNELNKSILNRRETRNEILKKMMDEQVAKIHDYLKDL